MSLLFLSFPHSSLGCMPHQDMLLLLISTDRYTLLSGMQSNEIFCLNWKQNVALVQRTEFRL